MNVEVTGPLAASIWVSSESEKINLFLTLRHFDVAGDEVLETDWQGALESVAKGRVQTSNHELNPAMSPMYRPYYKTGGNTIHADGEYESYLLLPIILKARTKDTA